MSVVDSVLSSNEDVIKEGEGEGGCEAQHRLEARTDLDARRSREITANKI